MASLKPWIEQDALKSLQHKATESNQMLGQRAARVTALGSGWRAAGINYSFGRTTTSPHPSITIADGKHEIIAYLMSEGAQSTAFLARPPLAVGSRIRLETAEFVPESTLLPEGTVPDDIDEMTPGVTFALALYGPVRLDEASPILNLNRSKKFRQAVGKWMMKKMDENETMEESTETMTISAATTTKNNNSTTKRSIDNNDDDGENGSVASSETNTESINSTTVDSRPKKKRIQVRFSWEEKLEHLQAYRDEVGHCNVPAGYKRGTFALGTWVNQMRRSQKDGTVLSKKQKKQLTAIGFVWNLAEHNWNRNFKALKQFKRENGDTSTPISYKSSDGLNLGTWVYNQRQSWKSGKLNPDRKKKLESIDFDFVCATAQRRLSREK